MQVAQAEDDRVPRLAPGWEEKAGCLSPEEGFLLSRIDGITSWRMLRRMGGIPPERVDGCLQRWVAEGLIVLELERAPAEPPPARTVVPQAMASPGAVDASLDLPVELQEQILAFEADLDQPYHAILGVARDADDRAIKRAYFELSKVFHPDRYFRKNVGGFSERLDRVFKKIALAYELLMDPTTRAEVERSLRAQPAHPTQPVSGAPPQKLSRHEWLAHVRRHFRMPDKIVAERRFKAKQFAEAARVAQHQEHWTEAASCIRLAIAFDPWSDEYKEAFGEVQARVNQLRAEQLLEKASGACDANSRSEAMRLFEEALSYRPSDPEILERAARVALDLEDFEQAHEYAERACELAAENAQCHLLLGQALRREGLRDRARQVLEGARQLDPDDPRIQLELERCRPKPARHTGGVR